MASAFDDVLFGIIENNNCDLYISNTLATAPTILTKAATIHIRPKIGFNIVSCGWYHEGVWEEWKLAEFARPETGVKDGSHMAIMTVRGGFNDVGSLMLEVEPFGEVEPEEVFISQNDLDVLSGLNLLVFVNGSNVDVPSVFEVGDSIKFFCVGGYRFVGNRFGGYVDGVYKFIDVVSGGSETVEKELDFVPDDISFFNFKTEEIPPPKEITFIKESDINYSVSNNFRMVLNGVDVIEPIQANVDDVLLLIADVGYSFIDNDVYYYADGFSTIAEVVENYKILKLVFNHAIPSGFGGSDASNIQKAETTKDKPDIMGEVNHLYSVNKENIRALNEKRFFEIKTDQGNLVAFDYSKFIINLLMFPFEIPDDVIGADEKIVLADFIIDSEAPTILTDNITIDMGIISVSPASDLIGYKGKEVKLYLPMSNPINLSPDFVIGADISITLVLNAYTGLATYDIHSSIADSSIHNFTLDLGVNIPFANTGGEPSLFISSDLQTGGDNYIRQARIEILDFINNDLSLGMFSTSVKEYSTIENQSGYFRIEDFENKTGIVGNDLDVLINLLSEGVFYND